MRIAIFDYQVVRNNPIGGCHRRLLNALADEHEFTVFAVQFDNPRPDRIKWVRVPAPSRPLPLLFLTYHLLAPLVYFLHLARTRKPFDLIQTVESKLCFGDLAYTHFCHTAYLKRHWSKSNGAGLRTFSRWFDHRLHACFEHVIYRLVKQIVVPSGGLAEEVLSEFPRMAGKIQVVPNAVDVELLEAPSSFERERSRAQIGVRTSDLLFVFAALGHFERKGLPLLMEALSTCGLPQAKLLVVGGNEDLIASYRRRAAELGIADKVIFVGMQQDVRPYFWSSNAFALASNYETFSLVAFEAAAAALPLITTRLHGVEDLAKDGENGFVVERTANEFRSALRRFAALTGREQCDMGVKARCAAAYYNESRFVDNWRQVYQEWTPTADLTSLSAHSAV